MQAIFQLADDVGEIRDRPLVWLQHVDSLDGVPELALFLEVEPVTLLVAFDQHAEKTEEELQILFRGRKREGIDGEVARFLANVQVAATEDRRERLEAAADIEDEGEWLVLLRVLQKEDCRDTILPLPVMPRISVWATSPLCRFKKVRRAVVGLQYRQVLRAQMRIRLLARQDREQKAESRRSWY